MVRHAAWACFAILAVSTLLRGAEPLEQLQIRSVSSSGLWAHLDGGVYMRGDQPICAFGVVQPGDAKPSYTYFVLFKQLKLEKDDSLRVTGSLRSRSKDTKYDLIISVGKREVVLSHHMVIDEATKTLTTDDFRIGKGPYKPGDGRMLLVDLEGESPRVTPLDIKLPAKVLDPRAESGHLTAIADVMRSLLDDNKGLKERLARE